MKKEKIFKDEPLLLKVFKNSLSEYDLPTSFLVMGLIASIACLCVSEQRFLFLFITFSLYVSMELLWVTTDKRGTQVANRDEMLSSLAVLLVLVPLVAAILGLVARILDLGSSTALAILAYSSIVLNSLIFLGVIVLTLSVRHHSKELNRGQLFEKKKRTSAQKNGIKRVLSAIERELVNKHVDGIYDSLSPLFHAVDESTHISLIEPHYHTLLSILDVVYDSSRAILESRSVEQKINNKFREITEALESIAAIEAETKANERKQRERQEMEETINRLNLL